MTPTPWSQSDVDDLDQALIAASGPFTARTRALLADALDLAQDAMEARPVADQFLAAPSPGGPGVDLHTVAGHIRTTPTSDPFDPVPDPVGPVPDPVDPVPDPVDPVPDPVDPGPDPEAPGPAIR